MKYNLIKYCEFDKYAYKSYDAIHGTTQENNLGDIYNANFLSLPQADLIVGGSPCQDFSIAGNSKGAIWECKECSHKYNPLEQHWSKRDCCPKCNSTSLDKSRSSLVVEYLRAIRENKPKFFIYENVKNLVSSKHKLTFNLFLKELDEYGYDTHFKILNAKDYNIPQNRERIFVIGIKKGISKGFVFPDKRPLMYTLSDVLENTVDEKFDITDFKDISPTLCARDYKDPKCVKVGNITGGKWDKMYESIKRVYSENGIAPTVHTCQGGNTEPKVLQTVCEQRCDEGLRFFKNDVVGTLRTIDSCGDKRVLTITKQATRLRKLTPLECWRLMGFTDEDFNAAQSVGMSNSQLYKQAGNSIVIDVLAAIYNELNSQYPNDFNDGISIISLFSGIGAFEKAFSKMNV